MPEDPLVVGVSGEVILLPVGNAVKLGSGPWLIGFAVAETFVALVGKNRLVEWGCGDSSLAPITEHVTLAHYADRLVDAFVEGGVMGLRSLQDADMYGQFMRVVRCTVVERWRTEKRVDSLSY